MSRFLLRGRDPGSHTALNAWSRQERFWKRYTRAGGPLWTHQVDDRIGALIARAVINTRVTPNHVTVLGLALSVATSIYVSTLQAPVSPPAVLVVVVGWQLAFSLDCGDGVLARSRRAASPFGAWLDQIADFVGKMAVYTALGIFLARSLRLGGVSAVLVVSLVFGASILQQFASSQRSVILGEGGGVHAEPHRWLRLLTKVRHLSDYGGALFLSALLLPLPNALLPFLVVEAVLGAGYVFAQVAYNWVRASQPR
ncbi:MAG TPA: CDP-alcohol phosphatidyltransferase family protein [Candidatus Dormibacteraeota bacterium]|nr:CDP-alcohol phosphatidyltransferase family protein [Candidatus Dormibacteraeota bacterium]